MVDKDLLSTLDFFSGLSPEQTDTIAGIGEVREYRKDDIIFRSNDNATDLFGVLAGDVDLSIIFEDRVLRTNIEYEEAIQARYEILEKPIVVDQVGPGDMFGWSALASPRKRTATARCGGPVRTVAFPSAGLKGAFENDPLLGYRIMERVGQIISRRLRNRTEKLIESWGECFGIDQV